MLANIANNVLYILNNFKLGGLKYIIIIIMKNTGCCRFYKCSALFCVLIMIPAHIVMKTRPSKLYSAWTLADVCNFRNCSGKGSLLEYVNGHEY